MAARSESRPLWRARTGASYWRRGPTAGPTRTASSTSDSDARLRRARSSRSSGPTRRSAKPWRSSRAASSRRRSAATAWRARTASAPSSSSRGVHPSSSAMRSSRLYASPPMAAQRVPVAVVGVGSMGRHHARNYAALEDADLVAVVDADRGRGEEVASAYGAELFPTIEDLLERGPRIVAASVATPTSLHHDSATTLLEHGVNVLVEKPLASTLDE